MSTHGTRKCERRILETNAARRGGARVHAVYDRVRARRERLERIDERCAVARGLGCGEIGAEIAIERREPRDLFGGEAFHAVHLGVLNERFERRPIGLAPLCERAFVDVRGQRHDDGPPGGEE